MRSWKSQKFPLWLSKRHEYVFCKGKNIGRKCLLLLLLISFSTYFGFVIVCLSHINADTKIPAEAEGFESKKNVAEENRHVLDSLAPITLKIDVCNGLTNQRIALLDGILIGIALGAQIVLPTNMPFNGMEIPGVKMEKNPKPLSDIFNIKKLQMEIRNSFRSYWCLQDLHPAREYFCNENVFENGTMYDPVSSYSAEEVQNAISLTSSFESTAKVVSIKNRELNSFKHYEDMRNDMYDEIGRSNGKLKYFVDGKCPLFSIAIQESDKSWDLFWNLSDNLYFSSFIEQRSKKIMSLIQRFRRVASKRARRRGFKPKDSSESILFNVLHLRAEKDWPIHCRNWMGIRDGIHRDNCANNTLLLHNTLISEGVDPTVPLYISTGLSRTELGSVEFSGLDGHGLNKLTEIFTVVTKDMLLEDMEEDWSTMSREKWAAVDYVISQNAEVFVGNSVSTFSAFLLSNRARRGLRSFHYNGGNVPLQDDGVITPAQRLAVPTLRNPLKWVFAIHKGDSQLSESFINMIKVAVKSAKLKTTLIAVCVTTESPTSELSKWLVQNGVRVIHHIPKWRSRLEKKLETSKPIEATTAKSHLSGDRAAMVGTFLRIDIPILGLIDEFVLYTDIDIMFSGEVSWADILEGHSSFKNVSKHVDFSRGRFETEESFKVGLPSFFAASTEVELNKDIKDANAGTMLMNMRNLRNTYESFLEFIFSKDELNWEEGPGDQGAYKAFYKNRISYLPKTLNWKSYWPKNEQASIVHFHGPKCERDILPYKESGAVNTKIFEFLLKRCADSGDCYKRCSEFQRYLREIHKL